MTNAPDPGEVLSRLMVVLPALWTAGCLVASRLLEWRAGWTADSNLARNRAERAQNLQDFSRIMPTPLLVVFAAGLVWEAGRLIRTLF